MEIVLNTFGACLNRDNNAFVVTNGDSRQRIPVQGVTSIQICRSAQITSDAVMLAIENEIEVLFMDRSGQPSGRVWSPRYGSVSTIRKGQLAFADSHEAVVWIKEVLRHKMENQQAMLLMMHTEDAQIQKAAEKGIARIESYRTKILSLDGQVMQDVASQLRGWEGMASKIYFDVINLFLPARYRFEARSQHPATDVANAMLNYGYGLLYAKVEGALIKAGIDPYIGILHRDEYNRPVLVYDVIENYRIWTDYIVFNLLMQEVVNDDYYSMREDGACWMEGLGRRVLIQSFNDYMDEIVTMKGTTRSRLTQIQLYAQSLAQTFKNHNT